MEEDRQYKFVKRFGYEYTLVLVEERYKFDLPTPKFMNYKGYALKSCKKLVNNSDKK